MGTRSAEEIEREIEDLRVDTDRVLTELESRFRDVLNVRAQAERHPLALSTVGLVLMGGLGLTAYTIYSRTVHKPGLRERFEERIHAVRGFTDEVESRERESEARSGEGVTKKILWTFLSTLLVTLATFTARRFSATLWTKTMREKPPKK